MNDRVPWLEALPISRAKIRPSNSRLLGAVTLKSIYLQLPRVGEIVDMACEVAVRFDSEALPVQRTVVPLDVVLVDVGAGWEVQTEFFENFAVDVVETDLRGTRVSGTSEKHGVGQRTLYHSFP